MTRFPSVLAGFLLLAPAAGAQTLREPPSVSRDFGRFTFGITGGFQYWSLTALEGTLNDRAGLLAAYDFRFDPAQFDLTFSYGVEFQSMLNRDWFARGALEWTRLSWGDRDQAYIAQLGGLDRTPVSLTYESKVRTNPLLVTLGAGRAVHHESVRFGFSGNVILAPLRVEDVIEVFMEAATESEIVATGTGVGLGANVSVDYYTDVRTTLYADVFARLGSTTVKLEEGYWESSILPQKRRVDFSGAGIRLGLRWF